MVETLATAILGVLLFALGWVLIYVTSRQKEKDAPQPPTCIFSSDAAHAYDHLAREFQKLVFHIVCDQARREGKELISDHSREISDDKLISEHDVENAFRKAVAELRIDHGSCGACCDSLLDRIKNLQKKYEKQTP